MMTTQRRFTPVLRWWDCYGIILGIMIGTGIFSAFPAFIAQKNMSVLMIILTWILGGVFSWFGALCYSELNNKFPSSGGDYTYLSKIYSCRGEKLVSFLFGWVTILVIRPSSIAILAIIFGTEMQKLINPATVLHAHATLIIAIGAVTLLTLINIGSLHTSKNFQNIFTVAKILVVSFIAVYAFVYNPADLGSPALPTAVLAVDQNQAGTWFAPILGLMSALILCMWVYGGWNEAVYVVEETIAPRKSIPKALAIGIFTVTILYVGINLAYIKMFTPQGLAENFNPASSLMNKWFGAWGSVCMSAIIAISALGAINGLILTGGRISNAIARDFNKLSFFALLNKRSGTPATALFANLGITLFLLLLSRGKADFIESLAFYTGGIYWYFFGLVVIGLLIARKKLPEGQKQRGLFSALYPYLFLAIIAGLIWGALDYKTKETLLGICVLNLGIPIYYLLRIDNRRSYIRIDDNKNDLPPTDTPPGVVGEPTSD